MAKKLTWTHPLTCEECRALLPDFLREKLDTESTGRVRGHLHKCEACDEIFAKALAEALSTGAEPPVEMTPRIPPFPAKELLQAWQAAKQGEGMPRVVDVIKMLREERDPELRCAAVWRLAVIGEETPEVINALRNALRDENAQVRMAAAYMLKRMGPTAQEAIPDLRRTLQEDADPNVRYTAAKALGAMQGTAREAIPDLEKVQREDEEADVRRAAAKALRRLRAEADEIWEKLRRTLERWRSLPALRPALQPVPTWGGEGEKGATLPATWVDAQGQPLDPPPAQVEVLCPPVVSAEGKFSLTLRLPQEAVGGTVRATLLLMERGEVSVEAQVEGEKVTLAATGWPALGEEVPVPLERLRLYLLR